ncbi:MAG: hypothetical protein HON90_18130 [Halobacteriovoraceae bacterium]|jgi:hypothetical protein|nr:hypothetical protein [Halobacteriovoraceae bacterium]
MKTVLIISTFIISTISFASCDGFINLRLAELGIGTLSNPISSANKTIGEAGGESKGVTRITESAKKGKHDTGRTLVAREGYPDKVKIIQIYKKVDNTKKKKKTYILEPNCTSLRSVKYYLAPYLITLDNQKCKDINLNYNAQELASFEVKGLCDQYFTLESIKPSKPENGIRKVEVAPL